MNFALEYLLRTNLIKNIFDLPCSLFMEQGRSNILVITIYKRDLGYLIKHWHINDCAVNQALPSFTEFLVPEEKIANTIKVKNFRPIRFYIKPVPSRMNSYSHPMPKSVYDFYSDNFLTNTNFFRIKREWLWQHFFKTYFNKTILNLYRVDPFTIQQELVKKHFKYYWNFWEQWEKHMLIDVNLPGEIAFYNDFFAKLFFRTRRFFCMIDMRQCPR